MSLAVIVLASTAYVACVSSAAKPATAAQSTTQQSFEAALAKVGANLTSPGALASYNAAAGILGQLAVTGLEAAAQKDLGSSGPALVNAAASGLWSASSGSPNAIGQVINSFAAGQLPATAKYAQDVATTQNGNSTAQVINAIATVLSTGVGAPPANPKAGLMALAPTHLPFGDQVFVSFVAGSIDLDLPRFRSDPAGDIQAMARLQDALKKPEETSAPWDRIMEPMPQAFEVRQGFIIRL